VPLFVVANLVVLNNTDAPKASTTSLTVEVTGHQWFWERRRACRELQHAEAIEHDRKAAEREAKAVSV
jgi:heme/copper-type cytochrome/quinol oxidase subunit 2